MALQESFSRTRDFSSGLVYSKIDAIVPQIACFLVGADTSSGATHATIVPDSKKMDMPHVVAATAKWVRDLVYRVTGIYGRGRTIYTSFEKVHNHLRHIIIISATLQAIFMRTLDLCIAPKGGRFEHLLKQQKREKKTVKKLASTNVEDTDSL